MRSINSFVFSFGKGILLGIFLVISLSALITQASGPDGVFGDYFSRIITGISGNGKCPTGKVIVGFSTGSTDYGTPICESPSMTLTGSSGFGDLMIGASDTVYQAMTDGFALAIPGNNGSSHWSYLQGEISDTLTGPWTMVLTGRGYSPAGGQGSITMPVKKGKYWRITTGYGVGAYSVMWLPDYGGTGSGSSKWNYAPSGISYTGGEVGIGINIPSLPLDVSGSIMARGATADIDANRNIWAQAFFDRDDSNYLVDPNGTTNLNTLCLNGECKAAWPGSGTSGGTVTGNLRWSNEYSGQDYDSARNTCLSLSPALAWRLPTADEIEYTRGIDSSLFSGIKNYWSSSPSGSSHELHFLSWDPTNSLWDFCKTTNIAKCTNNDGSTNEYPMAFRCVSNLE